MYQNKSILKSKKFQYALVFLVVGTFLAFAPSFFKLNTQTVHLLRLLLNADVAIGSLVIGGHSLTDAVSQYVNRPQFKELVSEFSPILEAAGIDQEVQDTILSFLKENGIDIA